MKIKKLLVFVFLSFAIILSGCAKVQYQHIFNADGTIVDSFVVELDEASLNAKNVNVSNLKFQIKDKMTYYMQIFINAFYSRDDGLSREEKNSIFSNVDTKIEENEKYIIARFTFKNATAFTYFYGYQLIDDTDDGIETTEGTFYNTSVSSGKTIFSSDVAKNVAEEFRTSETINNKFTLDDVKFYYTFGTTHSKIHSNATYQFDENGVCYHQWALNTIDDEIITFTLQPKPINWYILALSLTFILAVILYVISLFTRKKQSVVQNQANINGTSFVDDEENN